MRLQPFALLLVCAALLAPIQRVWAQSVPRVALGQPQSIRLGEVLVLHYFLQANPGVECYAINEFAGTLRLRVTSPDGQTREEPGPQWAQDRSMEPWEIGVIPSFRTLRAFVTESGRLRFPEPGRYTVQLVTKGDPLCLPTESNSVSFEVVEPTRKVDVELWNWIRTNAQAARFVESGDSLIPGDVSTYSVESGDVIAERFEALVRSSPPPMNAAIIKESLQKLVEASAWRKQKDRAPSEP